MLIKLNKMIIPVVLGLYDWEKSKARPVECSIELEVQDDCGINDDIATTVDYDVLRSRIVNQIQAKEYDLIEKLTQEIGEICLSVKLVTNVKVEVVKFSPIPDTESVSVIKSFTNN